MPDRLRELIEQWRDDPSATYQTWFLWDERLKNFRSIRRGIGQVVEEIETGRFGVAYRGSSLETIVHSVAEQRQIFRGADHAFLWKPKLRIPDIYENPVNQRAFGRLLHHCSGCSTGAEILSGIRTIDQLKIKGLGPAVANLIYFLHPTYAPPFNTAIVNGYNAITGSKVKLGSWEHYLAMREGILALNARYRDLLSNDLGALAGFLFDVGSGRYPAPPVHGENLSSRAWSERFAEGRIEALKFEKRAVQQRETDRTHTEIQAWIRDLGRALGYRVWIAANDRGRIHEGARLGQGCLDHLPAALANGAGAESIRLIDVLWLEAGADRVTAAFEVEHSTTIYSGVVRMLDLALSGELHTSAGLFLVAPDSREGDVRAQLQRPAFSRIADLDVRYLPYGELDRHRESIARFGTDLRALTDISYRLI